MVLWFSMMLESVATFIQMPLVKCDWLEWSTMGKLADYSLSAVGQEEVTGLTSCQIRHYKSFFLGYHLMQKGQLDVS